MLRPKFITSDIQIANTEKGAYDDWTNGPSQLNYANS
jgi:hypothetical protein